MRDIFNQITLSGTVTAKSYQHKTGVAILNLEIKHFGKKPFKIQAKLWGKRAELITKIVNENDRIAITGKLQVSTYKGMEEFVIVGEKVAKIDNLKGQNEKEEEC